jgi:hypothetical protein
MSIEGVDYAFPPIPSPAALKAAGKHFACRYGGPGSDSKQLHASELKELRAAGIDVVANAEGAANGFRGTSAGKSWAQQAIDHFGPLGIPDGRPIYFSVDWDAGPGDWADIDAALHGAASIIGASRVGVYGSYDVMQHCRTNGTARWFWMTYAWSGGRTPPSYVHLYQYKNGQRIGGSDCDFTRALLPDYGQWGYQEDSMSFIDTQDDFNKAMNAWAGTSAGATALCKAVLNTDNVIAAPNASTSDNKFWAAASFLQNTYLAATSGRDYAASDAATGRAIQADLADGVPANVDVAALATALDALLPNVTIDEQTVISAFRDMAAAAQPPAAS